MASYKVLQDIEAEDKLIGPLTFRQFVYAGACVLNLYLTFLVVTKGAPFMGSVFLPIALISGFFAWPFAGDQPTEVWALARIRFVVKPRRRIWNQSGVKELVTVTAPKKIEHDYTKGLSPNEVESRLKVLADTIDSRGWAIKNVNVNLSNQPSIMMNEPDSDRLISISSIPQQVPIDDIRASDDMLDEKNNPTAQQFDAMLNASTKAHRQQIIERLRQSSAPAPPKPPAANPQPNPQSTPKAPANNYWFLNQPTRPGVSSVQDAVTFNAQVIAPGTNVQGPTAATPTPDEEALVRQLSQNNQAADTNGHLHTIQPLSAQAHASGTQNPAQVQPPGTGQSNNTSQQATKVTPAPDAGILELARNDDLNVATIAREAHKRSEPDEVVISLH